MYIISWESATNVVNMGKRVEIVWKGKNKPSTYCKNYGHIVEGCYSIKKYGQEFTYCHKKGHKEKFCWKKQKDDEYKEKEKSDVTEKIYHVDFFWR